MQLFPHYVRRSSCIGKQIFSEDTWRNDKFLLAAVKFMKTKMDKDISQTNAEKVLTDKIQVKDCYVVYIILY